MTGLDSDLVLVYVTCGSEEEAVMIARRLLDERLIACANIYESRSLYNWHGTVADEREKVLVCKTIASRAPTVERRIGALHSYEVPCILRLAPLHTNPKYLHWVRGEVMQSSIEIPNWLSGNNEQNTSAVFAKRGE